MGVFPLKNIFLKNGRLSLWLRFFLAAALLYIAVCGLFAPLAARQPLEKHLESVLGARCSIGRIAYNPFTFTVSVKEFSLSCPDGSEFLRIGELRARLGRELLLFTPSLSGLKIINPEISLTRRKDGSFAPGEFAGNGGFNGTGVPPFILRDLDVEGGRIEFYDSASETRQILTEIALHAPFTSSLAPDQDKDVRPELTGNLNGKPFRLRGVTRPFSQSLRTEFELDLEGMTLKDFRPYLAGVSSFVPEQGGLDASLRLVLSRSVAPDEGAEKEEARPTFQISGRLELNDLVLREERAGYEQTGSSPSAGLEEAASLSLKKGIVVLENLFSAQPGGVTIESVMLEEPRLSLTRDKAGNLPRLFGKSAGEAPSAAPEEHANSGTFLLKRLEIANGTISFKDKSLARPYEQELTGLNCKLAVIASEPGQTGEYSLRLALKKGGEANVTGRWSLAPFTLAVNAELEAIPLSVLNPYLEFYGGLNLGQGKMDSAHAGAVITEQPKGLSFKLEEGRALVSGLEANKAENGPLLPKAEVTGLKLEYGPEEKGRLAAASLSLHGPRFALLRDRAGNFSLRGLPKPSGGQESEPAWQFELAALQIENGQLEFIDAVNGRAAQPLFFEKISLSAEGLSTKNEARIKAQAAARLSLPVLRPELRGESRGGKGKPKAEEEENSLRLSLQGRLAPLSLSGQCRLERLPLRAANAYLKELAGLTAGSGNLSGEANFTLEQGPENNLSLREINGEARSGGLSLLRDGRELAGWGLARAEEFSYSAQTGRLLVKNLDLARPRFTYLIGADGKNNLQALTRNGSEKPEERAEGPLRRLSVGSLTIRNGLASFRDERPESRLDLSLKDLEASASGLDSGNAGGRSGFSLSGVLDSAPLRAAGFVNRLPLFTDEPFTIQGNCNIDGLDLTPLSPYAVKFVAYPVQRGKMYLDAAFSLDGKALRVENAIRFARLELGDQLKSPGAPDLPLKFALGMLRDGAGDISIFLPVEGRIDDPQFVSGGIVGRVVGNLALSVVTSPFSLLGAIFSSDGERHNLEFVFFEPGGDKLDEQGGQTIKAALELLRTHPRLNLEITGTSSWAEADALAERKVLDEARAIKRNSLNREQRRASSLAGVEIGPNIDLAEYERLVFAVYREKTGDNGKAAPPLEEMMRELRARCSPDEEDLKALALTRAKAVRDYILALDPALAPRIELEKPAVYGETGNAGEQGQRVRLGASSR